MKEWYYNYLSPIHFCGICSVFISEFSISACKSKGFVSFLKSESPVSRTVADIWEVLNKLSSMLLTVNSKKFLHCSFTKGNDQFSNIVTSSHRTSFKPNPTAQWQLPINSNHSLESLKFHKTLAVFSSEQRYPTSLPPTCLASNKFSFDFRNWVVASFF